MPVMRTLGLCALTLLLLASLAGAKVVKNPDANTLWIEDGTAIETGAAATAAQWSNTLEFATVEEGGGFTITTPDPTKYAAGRYLPVDPDFPYVVTEITDVAIVREGYRGFSLSTSLLKTTPLNIVSNAQKGLYVYKPFVNVVDLKKGDPYWRVDVHGWKITFKYLKVVKEPDYCIEVTTPTLAEKKVIELGDDVTFTVRMKEEAEDVTLTFFDSYTMPQLRLNDEQKLQLKPEKDNAKVWTATVKVTSVTGDMLKADQQFTPGRMLIKATILGGGLKVPLWTNNAVEFRFKPQKEEK